MMSWTQEGTGAGPEWCWGSCQIPRGDLQTTFLFKGFDEARRLGLNRATEAEVRAALAAAAATDVSVSGRPTPLSHLLTKRLTDTRVDVLYLVTDGRHTDQHALQSIPHKPPPWLLGPL